MHRPSKQFAHSAVDPDLAGEVPQRVGLVDLAKKSTKRACFFTWIWRMVLKSFFYALVFSFVGGGGRFGL
jgi:hypothetical protein